MNRNEQVFGLLGMPRGTAFNRLRKGIMFSLIVRLGEDDCYRCGRLIESADDLSVEHKVPWERDNGKAKELFFDLENIAFSHLKCNIGAAEFTPARLGAILSNRKNSPLSERKFNKLEKYCPFCGKMKLLEDFSLNTSKVSQRENECRECRSIKRSGGREAEGAVLERL